MSSDKDSPDATPVWCTGSDPIEVELVTSGKTYSVDTDIAKRMGIPQEGRETESPFKLADCTDHDFERALVFCAQDRACSDPPSTELAHIIQTLSVVPPEPTSEPTPDTLSTTFANINLAEDDEDESYVPSESESSSESDEEYSDTDIGTANIQAESEEYQARQKEKEKEKEKEKDKEKEQPGV